MKAAWYTSVCAVSVPWRISRHSGIPPETRVERLSGRLSVSRMDSHRGKLLRESVQLDTSPLFCNRHQQTVFHLRVEPVEPDSRKYSFRLHLLNHISGGHRRFDSKFVEKRLIELQFKSFDTANFF